MKWLLSIALCYYVCTSATAQVGYYKTYDDFLNNSLTSMDEYIEVKNAGNAFNIWFMKGGKKVKILSEDIWGYRNGAALYRLASVNQVDVPVRVLFSGDGETSMCLYIPYQTELKNNNGKPDVAWNKEIMAYGMVFNWCFISKALNTSVTYCGVGSSGFVDDFRDNYPQFQPFFDCTGKEYKNNQLLVDCYQKAFPQANKHF